MEDECAEAAAYWLIMVRAHHIWATQVHHRQVIG